MSERELDSSINDYIETETPKNYVKQIEWDMAIGLQEVDNLKPSKYLEKLIQENITGKKTIYEVEKELKEHYAKKEKIKPEKIFVVSVMPCIAKKYERQRRELSNNGLYDVDCVITTRELSRMIKHANIRFEDLEDSQFDNPLGVSTGAASIFGTTGGVMEAALRTAQDILTGKDLKKIDFEQVRGEKGIKKATVNIAGKDIKVAVASGLGNAKKIIEEISSGKSDYQFVEIMACPGGCIMGGGQPIKNSRTRAEFDVRKLRADSIYSIDEKCQIRKSNKNPVIKKVYEEYLESPGSYRAEKLLHTKYGRII